MTAHTTPRTVVVSGGVTGIGRETAAGFAAAGDRVWITGRRADVLDATADELGPGVTAVRCDHTDPADVEAFAAQLPDRVDVLVNNAGGNTAFDEDDPATGLAAVAASWQRNLSSNLVSAVLLTEALRDRLGAGSAVISIGSIAADKGASAYGAAKAGIAAWNVGLASELGPQGVTANVVAPGYIAETEFFRDKLTDDRRDSLVAAAFTRRAGTPSDIAQTIAFLAGPGARQLTGQTINVNGGERTTR